MDIDMNKENWSNGPCPKFDCRKKGKCDCCGLRYVNIPAALTTDMAPKDGAFCNAIVKYEGTGEVWVYSTEGIPTLVYKEPEITPTPPVVSGGFIVHLSHTPTPGDEEVTLFRDEQETVPITIREILDIISEGTYVIFKDKVQDKYYPLIWALDCPENDMYEIAFRDENSQCYALASDPSDSTMFFNTEMHEAFRPAELNALRGVAPGADTVGELGQLYTDVHGMHTYQCTAISGNRYTWTQRW